jgi:hypothetical protein
MILVSEGAALRNAPEKRAAIRDQGMLFATPRKKVPQIGRFRGVTAALGP